MSSKPLPLISSPTPYATIGKFQTQNAGTPGLSDGQDIFQVLSSKGQVICHMNSNGAIDPPLFPQIVVVEVSPAQMLTLDSIPVVLIPSPGPGKYIFPQAFTAQYDAGKTPYTVTGADGFFYIGWNAMYPLSENNNLGFFPDTTFIDQSTSQVFIDSSYSAVSTPLTEAVNQPLILSIVDALTLGNGTLQINISYIILEA